MNQQAMQRQYNLLLYGKIQEKKAEEGRRDAPEVLAIKEHILCKIRLVLSY